MAEALAFIGNSLLAPMNRTEKVGAGEAFWLDFPVFSSSGVRCAVDRCRRYVAHCAGECESSGRDISDVISAEFTMLFVGPPRPAAAPWETYYRTAAAGGTSFGFGTPTVEMRRLLRGYGIEMVNENNQYEDHMGIELLLLSILLSDVTQGEATREEVVSYLEEHPGSWISEFAAAVERGAPGGYYSCLLKLAEELLALVSSGEVWR